MSGLNLRMPFRFLRASFAHLALTVAALASGVALICAFDLASRTVLHSFMEIIDTMAGRAALQVTAGHGGLFHEHVAARVGRIRGVELAVPVVSATAFTVHGGGELLTVHGIDITHDAAVRVYTARDSEGIELDDPLVFLSQPESIAITREFAGRRALELGDPLTLDTPMGRKRFRVRGLLDADGVARAYGGNLVVMDLQAAEAAFTRPHFINRLDVVVASGEDVAQVRRAIAEQLPAGLRVEAPAQRKADLHKVMRSLQTLLRGMGLTGLIAAFLIVFNRLATVFDGRAWQLGMLRAAGLRVADVWRELLKEGAVLGVAGAIVGVPLGIALGRLLVPTVATTTSLNYTLIAPAADFTVPLGSVALAAGLGVAAAVLAAVLPAWRAARVPPAETLRHRGVEQASARPGAVWLARILTMAAIVGAVGMQSVTHSPTWGLLASGLIAVGAAVIARPFLRVIWPLLLPAVRWLAGPGARFAAATVVRNPRRAALTVATLGVGLGAVLSLWTIAESFEQTLIDMLSKAYRSDLVVASSHIASGFLEAPIDDDWLRLDRMSSRIRRVDGVSSVACQRTIDWHFGDGPIAINAFDPVYFVNPEFGRWPLLGEHQSDVWEQVAEGKATVVSSNLALNLGIAVGDTITIETPTGLAMLPVAGVTVSFASPRGTIEMSRELYAHHWNDTQVTRLFVLTDPGADIGHVRTAIARAVGRDYGVHISSSGALVVYFAEQVRRAFAPVDVLAGMVLLVVLIAVADTLAAGVAERTRELGALRAVGVERRYLRRMVMAEGLALGVIGLVIAAVTGLALGTLWVEATFPFLLGWVLELHIPYGYAAVTALTTLGVCLVAALLPALYAARLDPAVALRYE
jgi:putative ABC transport system permease protein